MEGLNKAIDTTVEEHEACSQERFETLYKKIMDNTAYSETLREHNQTELVNYMRLLLLRQDLILSNQSTIMQCLREVMNGTHSGFWSQRDLLNTQARITDKVIDDDVIREKELKKKLYG